MTNNKALTLALVMAGLAAVFYRYGYRGTAIVAVMATCVLAAWPIRLRWGPAGKEQWREIRLRGRAYFVITHGVGLFAVVGAWSIAPFYLAYEHLPNNWARQLFTLLCVGCIYGLLEWRAKERKYSEHGQRNPEIS